MRISSLFVLAAATAGCGTKKEAPDETSSHEPIAVMPGESAPAAAESGPSLLVSAGGVWLGAAEEEATFVPRCAAGIDSARLEAELCRLAGARPTSFIEIASRHELAHGDIVLAMDAAVALGFSDVTLLDEASLSIEFPVDPPPPAIPPPCTDPTPCTLPRAGAGHP